MHVNENTEDGARTKKLVILSARVIRQC